MGVYGLYHPKRATYCPLADDTLTHNKEVSFPKKTQSGQYIARFAV
jgi:hypothetical protein